MSIIIKFGEDVPGYNIPVLNEREIRASAGILFVLMFVAINRAAGFGNFTLLKYAIIYFLLDFSIRVFINPKYAPLLIISKWIVRNQTPEYVGAIQKKFAWVIGLILAVTMVIFQIVLNTYGPITGIICMICLVFLFFEAAFGICLGCKTYKWIYKENAQYCPGEICEVKSRHDIQKINLNQALMVVAFIAFIVASVFIFNDNFIQQPSALFGPEMQHQAK